MESGVQKESWACKCEDAQLLVGESMENPMSCHINLNKALFFSCLKFDFLSDTTV